MIEYTPPPLGRPGEVIVSPWASQSLGVPLLSTVFTINSGTGSNWIAANVGVFVPFTIPEATTFTKMAWGNGSAVAGNIDVGIFDEAGNLLVASGSTAQATITTLQVVDITDTTIARGRYYLGMTSDTSGVTQKVSAVVPSAGICQGFGVLKDTSCAPPFSTNANPAVYVAYDLAFIPLIVAQGFRAVGP